MLEFSELTLRDINNMKPYFTHSINKICDNTVGGAFMWRDYFSVQYAEYNDTIIFKVKVKYHGNITSFSMPLGKDVHGSIAKVVEYCRHHDIPVSFCTLTSEDIAVLRTVFDDFQLFKEVDWSDYVYHAEDLITLSGRKFHGQRNHINYFKKTFTDYSFEEISKDNLECVKNFYKELSSTFVFDSEIFAEEHRKVIEVLDNYDEYGLFGGVLRANGSVIAFSVGEVVNGVLFVHIEKADLRYRGAYQVINNEFAKHFASDGVEFINREEDVGDPGLRISKSSYHPCEIIDKYVFLVV